jgi:hypothetical protein
MKQQIAIVRALAHELERCLARRGEVQTIREQLLHELMRLHETIGDGTPMVWTDSDESWIGVVLLTLPESATAWVKRSSGEREPLTTRSPEA